VAATSNDAAARRVATVTDASVTQTVESSGTIVSSLKLMPSFAASGTVRSVKVKVGDAVHKGQTLAKLDTTALRAALDSAESTLAGGKEQLQADETGQTTTGGASTSGGVSTIAYVVQFAAAQPGRTSLSALVAQIEAAQKAVVTTQKRLDAGQAAVDAAQKTVDAAVTENITLRDAQNSACATSASPTPAPSDSPSDPSDPSDSVSNSASSDPSTDCSTAMADYEAFADTLVSDMGTLDAKIAAQDGYTNDLQQATATLDMLIGQLKSASDSSGGGSGGLGQPSNPPSSGPSGSAASGAPSGAPSGSSQTGPGGNGSAPGSAAPAGGTSIQSGNSHTAQPASAAQIAADQAAIDAEQAQVTVAKQNLAAATLTSPATGKVAAVGLTAGDSSSGQSITIVGTGVQGVDVQVPLAQIDQVKAGQPVSVSVDGHKAALRGTIDSIGVVGSTSGSTTTFPVTIELAAGSPRLYDGTGAAAVITTARATNVITVPNSAIHTGANGSHTVTVVEGGAASSVPVTVGIAGDDITQITSGLKAGQQVVIADLGQPLPESTTSTATTFRPGLFGGAGGFGGRGTGS
jgi:HlyD family secretion protein